jgi:predicted hotdog family 3-hydroxylacyl-ACP dehydratase
MVQPPETWLPLESPRVTPEGRWESMARFGTTSGWFSGHFEKFPLLPGVALLALASETLKRKALENGRFLDLLGFSRVRFKHLVLPDEELCISVAAMPGGPEAKLDFEITCQGKLVAHGFLKVQEKAIAKDEGIGKPLQEPQKKIANEPQLNGGNPGELVDQEELFPAESLIPHRHIMGLLKWVKRPIEKTLQAETTVRDNWPLHRDGMVSPVISIELVAQAIAALRTWNGGEGAIARLGFVVGVKEAEFPPSSFPVGTKLFIHIAEIYHVGEYAVYEGQVVSASDFPCKIMIQAMEPEEGVLSDLTSR